jgi:hypothetical protein
MLKTNLGRKLGEDRVELLDEAVELLRELRLVRDVRRALGEPSPDGLLDVHDVGHGGPRVRVCDRPGRAWLP